MHKGANTMKVIVGVCTDVMPDHVGNGKLLGSSSKKWPGWLESFLTVAVVLLESRSGLEANKYTHAHTCTHTDEHKVI